MFFTSLYVAGNENENTVSSAGSESRLTEVGTDQNVSITPSKAMILQKKVTGKVVDNNGEPMPGVNILVKDTDIGTVTDLDGNFEIAVESDDAVLVFSFIGYEPQEMTVGTQTVIDITLQESIEQLEEVVVVGYGTMKKSDVTGAIVSVDEDALQEVPVANIQQALQGRAAGLEVQKIGTAPGAGARIRIRGERSILGNNDPLIILDGIPFEGGSLNDIDQNSISSVEILKDASATAIYGSRGANGVILITTKKGKAGETKVNYSGYYGVTTVARAYEVFNGEEYAAMRDAGPRAFSYEPLELESMAIGRETNWQNLLYEDGYVTDHNLSATGGSDIAQFSVGVGYYKETTVLPEQDFTRYSVRASVETKIGSRIKVGLNTMNTVHITNGAQFVNGQQNTSDFETYSYGSNIMYPILALSPLMPAYDSTGQILQRPAGNDTDRPSQYNPLYLKENDNEWVDRMRRLRTFNTFYGEVDIIDGLKYRINIGVDYRQQEFAQFQGADTYFRAGNNSRARVNNAEGWGYTIEHLLSYKKTFAEKHNLDLTGLFSVQEDHKHNTCIGKEGITADFIEYYDLNQSDPSEDVFIRGTEESWGLLSYMARINYNYDSRYLITITGRADGSSRLVEQWHYYPAVSIGWNINNESFMESITPISALKIRAGWGETSNQAVNPYTTLGGVSGYHYQGSVEVPIRYNYGVDGKVSGYVLSSIPDETLDWEYTRTFNIGLDFGLFANRISGTLEYYNAQTYNLLYNVTLPVTSGISGDFNTNIGETENKGFEATVSAVIIEDIGGFSWNADVNFFLNRNKILKLNGSVERNIANGLHVGYPRTAIYDYEKLGIWQLDEAAEAAVFGQLPGQLKIADISGPDGVPDGDIHPDYDRKVIGSGEADWQGGITNRFSYKGFDLSVVTYVRMGGLLVSYLHQPNRAYLTNLNGLRNGLKVDYWTPDNPTNWFPMGQAANDYTITPPNATTSWQTLGYYDASFVKIRSISLGYTVPKKYAEIAFIESARIYFTAQNPFLLYSPYVTKWNGVDPEPTGTGTMGAVGTPTNLETSGENPALVIGTSTPPTRSYIIGVNLTF